jgi:signal transduction histidine kinase
MLRLVVADDRRGFGAAVDGEGEGLASMHRRAARLSGACDVQAIPGIGTAVEVNVPTGHSRYTRPYLNT